MTIVPAVVDTQEDRLMNTMKAAVRTASFDGCCTLRVRVRRDGEHYVMEAHGAVAIANAIAYLSESPDPISILLGLTNKNLMKQSLAYLIWGEGETALMVYTILVRYWEWTKRQTAQPRIFLMSG